MLEQLSGAVTALTPEALANAYIDYGMPDRMARILMFETVTEYRGDDIVISGELTVFPDGEFIMPEDIPVSTNAYNPELPLTLKFVAQDTLCGLVHQVANYKDGELDADYAEAIKPGDDGEPDSMGIVEMYEKLGDTADCGHVCVRVLILASRGCD
jgi:hypothetical protein